MSSSSAINGKGVIPRRKSPPLIRSGPELHACGCLRSRRFPDQAPDLSRERPVFLLCQILQSRPEIRIETDHDLCFLHLLAHLFLLLWSVIWVVQDPLLMPYLVDVTFTPQGKHHVIFVLVSGTVHLASFHSLQQCLLCITRAVADEVRTGSRRQ